MHSQPSQTWPQASGRSKQIDVGSCVLGGLCMYTCSRCTFKTETVMCNAISSVSVLQHVSAVAGASSAVTAGVS
jgi:hypothetical protein